MDRDQRRDVLRPQALEPLDAEIIRILQEDGRTSATDIASALSVSPKTVRSRIVDLERRDIMRITAVVDPALLGYHSLSLVGIRVEGDSALTRVGKQLANLSRSDYVCLTTGRYNAFVELFCLDDDELLEILETQIAPIAGVRSSEVFPYLELRYQKAEFTQPPDRRPRPVRPHTLETRVDNLDRHILERLSENGRVSFRKLAASLQLPESRVRQRVNRLLDSGSVRVMAITNAMSLGFTTMAWVGISVAPGTSVTTLADLLSQVPAVSYLAICAGRFDIFIEVVCLDRRDLLRVVDQQVRTLPGISWIETFLYLRLHYKRVRPAYHITGRDQEAGSSHAANVRRQ